MDTFPGKLGVQQRVLARYRVPFFERLAKRCAGGLEVFSGSPARGEAIVVDEGLREARHVPAHNVYLGRGGGYVCWQRGLGRWLKTSRPDALVVAANPRLLSTYLAVRAMRAAGKPVLGWGLGTLKTPEQDGRLSFALRRIRSRFYHSFGAILAYSRKAADDYVAAGVPPDRVFVAPNAVSTEAADAAITRFPPTGEAVRRWRQRNQVSRPALIYVGRLIPEKRVEVLLEACATLGDSCDLVVIGDGPERAALEATAAARFPRARFLGYVEGEDLSLALAACDLFVLPGAGGLAIHEAMAHGRAVVVSQADGTERDLVQEGRNGRIVPLGDRAALTEAIRTFLADPAALAAAGRESRLIATEEVSIDAMVAAFMRALRYAGGGDAAG